MKLTDASSELADFDRSLKNEREVSSEGKAEESQKSGSTVKTSPSKAKPSNSIDEFFDGLLSGKSMNEMLFDSPPEDEATYIPPNDSQLFSPSHTPFENIRLAFVECCPSLPAPKEAKAWTEKRKRTVKSRWKKNPSMDFWYGFFHKIEDSDFLSGRKTDWRASFDWIMKPANFEKISEGCYRVFRDRLHYLPSCNIVLDSLEQICCQQSPVLRLPTRSCKTQCAEEHRRSQCPLRGERAAWTTNAEGCTLGKTILRHFTPSIFFLT